MALDAGSFLSVGPAPQPIALTVQQGSPSAHVIADFLCWPVGRNRLGPMSGNAQCRVQKS